MKARDKIGTAQEVRAICVDERRNGARVVFTNGCFDLMHIGHLRYLEAARALGDLLVVGVNSDRSVREIKGPLRPITAEAERCELVAGLQCVSWVTLFDAPDPLELIQLIEPDVLVKGADWPLERIVGAQFVQGKGGTVARIPLVANCSTTGIIEKIITMNLQTQ